MARKTKIDTMDVEDIEEELTQEQKDHIEMLKRGRRDPVCFANEVLGIRVHDGQMLWLWMTTRTQLEKAFELGVKMGRFESRAQFDELLKKDPDSLKNILIPSNRWGKTLVTSVKHIWYNFYKIGVRGDPDQVATQRCGTLNLSPHSNQCQAAYDYILDILFSKFVYTIEGVSYKNECKIPYFYTGDNSQKRLISFNNNTSYRSIPPGEDQASSLAGTSYLYISYDEAAQSLHLKEELPAKIMSRLIDFGGCLDLVSTPEVDKPSHQYFFHISKLGLKGEDGWYTQLGKITDNIFLGKNEVEKLAKSIKSTDPAKYRQVIFGEFITTGKKMFDSLLIERLWDSFVPSPVFLDHKYIVIADWGFSDTGDPTVFKVLDYSELLNDKIPKSVQKIRLAYSESIRGGSPFAVLMRAKMLQREWNGAKFIHDASSLGGVIIKKMLQEMEMHDVIDFSSSGGQKQDMLFSLLVVMSEGRQTQVDEEGKVTDLNSNFGRLRSYYIPELEEQLGNYQYNPDKGVSDKRIEQDEVMCLGMGIWWLERKFIKADRKSIAFNPLASTIDKIFSDKTAKQIHMHSLTIPEKRIL